VSGDVLTQSALFAARTHAAALKETLLSWNNQTLNCWTMIFGVVCSWVALSHSRYDLLVMLLSARLPPQHAQQSQHSHLGTHSYKVILESRLSWKARSVLLSWKSDLVLSWKSDLESKIFGRGRAFSDTPPPVSPKT
jgi:hypothetical protein